MKIISLSTLALSLFSVNSFAAISVYSGVSTSSIPSISRTTQSVGSVRSVGSAAIAGTVSIGMKKKDSQKTITGELGSTNKGVSMINLDRPVNTAPLSVSSATPHTVNKININTISGKGALLTGQIGVIGNPNNVSMLKIDISNVDNFSMNRIDINGRTLGSTLNVVHNDIIINNANININRPVPASSIGGIGSAMGNISGAGAITLGSAEQLSIVSIGSIPDSAIMLAPSGLTIVGGSTAISGSIAKLAPGSLTIAGSTMGNISGAGTLTPGSAGQLSIGSTPVSFITLPPSGLANVGSTTISGSISKLVPTSLATVGATTISGSMATLNLNP